MKNWILKFDIRKKCGFAPLQSKCFRFDPWLFNWHEQCLSCDVNVSSCLLSTHGWQFELARQVPIAKIFLEKKKLLRKADVYLVEIGQHEKATWVAKSSCYYHQSKVVIINWHTILPWQFLSLVQRKKGRVACNNNGIDTDGDLRYRQNPMTQFTLYETWMTMMEKWLITFSNGVIWCSSSNLQSHPNFGHLNCLFVSYLTSKNIEKRFLSHF